MEQGKGDRSEGGDNIPDDISDLVESIYGRDDQRQKAVLMNLENASLLSLYNFTQISLICHMVLIFRDRNEVNS